MKYLYISINIFLNCSEEKKSYSKFQSFYSKSTLITGLILQFFAFFACAHCFQKLVREKSRECHNHKPQPFPDPKRKRKPTNPHKHKSNKRTKSTKISSLFPKRGNHNTKRTEKHKNKMTHGRHTTNRLVE